MTAAMDLFGRQGYHATTIAQIEAAAGLSAGAGGLYRHFKSKRAVLEEGLERQASAGRELVDYLADGPSSPNPRERFLAVARAGLARLEQERDVNRLLLRDLASFPDLLDLVRERELRRTHLAVTSFLRAELPAERDPEALAAVVMAAVSHYWIMADVYGGRHPHEVDTERFLRALVRLVVPEGQDVPQET
ncbi:TetR/AcrR family transcriptional regulator [Actinoplanes sp. KI2]|uniref:TetR/AcrR family transcriptional regulator n=1 Tax=Actinoplanes sp. KI2 TaxID=2983315 RepID=UPI0021D5A1D7|nr:helix-turn-helix domain-containing protein [Actinoplanes sp. KI2]MCU7725130.1 TetR/AcrR family transcriptional regulator [Actinoplanes sp. KI2]